MSDEEGERVGVGVLREKERMCICSIQMKKRVVSSIAAKNSSGLLYNPCLSLYVCVNVRMESDVRMAWCVDEHHPICLIMNNCL